MNDQELKALAAFCAWIENRGLMNQSPTSLIGEFRQLQEASDPMSYLDLESLNHYVKWLKTWRSDLAPQGGAAPPEHLTNGSL